MFGEIIKPLKKEVVVRSTKEELPKKHNVGVVKTNKLTEIKQLPTVAPLDTKNWTDDSDVENLVKEKNFNKVIQTKSKITPSDNSKPFYAIETFSSSSSCSSITEDLIDFTDSSEFTENSKATSKTSSEIEIFKEAEKPEKTIISESCINVSLQNLQ